MSDLRKRPPAGTLQRRIFITLRDTGSMTAQELAARLGAQSDVAHRACLYLVARGKLRKQAVLLVEPYKRLGVQSLRGTRRVFFVAITGAHAPTDLRGRPAACRNHCGGAAFPAWLRMMRAKHGPTWRYVPKVHPLDAWMIGRKP